MSDTNTVTITGNVTRDPELRFTPNGTATASFGLAYNRRWLNKSTQEWEESTSFFDVVVWQDVAQNVAESVHRGDRVVVSGRLEQRSWETPEGERRSRTEIIADEVAPSLRYATAQVTKIDRRESTTATPPRPSTSHTPRPAIRPRVAATVPGADTGEPF